MKFFHQLGVNNYGRLSWEQIWFNCDHLAAMTLECKIYDIKKQNSVYFVSNIPDQANSIVKGLE